MPELQNLMNEFEWKHVESFPSILRLLLDLKLPDELRANKGRLASLEAIKFYRVIDNAPLTLSADDLWIQLNYQLVHLLDFLPPSNWTANASDTTFTLFRKLYALLDDVGQRSAKIDYTPASGKRSLTGDKRGVRAWLTTLIPIALSEKLAAKSVRQFSEKIGHAMDYELIWRQS